MTTRADCLDKLARSFRLTTEEAVQLLGRAVPVFLLEDFTQQFQATQRTNRPWVAAREGATPAGQFATYQVQLPATAKVVTEITHMVWAADGSGELEVHFPARGTAALGTQLQSQFRDRREVVPVATNIETSTVVSFANNVAAPTATPVMVLKAAAGGNALVLPLGIILGPNDVILFGSTNGGADIPLTFFGIERPNDI